MKIKRSHYVEGYMVHCMAEQVFSSDKVYRSEMVISVKEISNCKCKFKFLRHMLNKQKRQMICYIGDDVK